MSDSNESAPATATEQQSTVQSSITAAPATAAVAQQPPAQQSPVKVDMTPEQLKQRLDEERDKAAKRAKAEAEAAFVKSLGVTNVDEAKAKIEAQKKLEDEKRSELERKDREINELKPKAERAPILEAAVKRQSDAALASLTEEQRAAVTTIAGDDPVKVFDTIEALRPTWKAPATAAPAAAVASPAAAPKPVPAGATTAPPAKAPSPNDTQTGPVDHLAVWQELQKTKPHRAAHYYLHNQAAIVAAQNARSA